ncbi:hypothetical protein PUNSTDRAFT_134771 [Punctularia strigosozonata HHB-11173 SS5]|uniref:uncharacterized protein n=1 Tax=Punctularia strigosozonata (strain HHB-11173) TaxID=741275 RepID=UPI0004418133|nr:uncharacterized protein PUNSTDRAFT_134771 [Punctularia strigosozonata HHB-11173 SS5]EIN08384.1 hypothetical protein PUNSTDRAFT_134771 [Punctularia strigosozonata HHB-11173 SS5]
MSYFGPNHIVDANLRGANRAVRMPEPDRSWQASGHPSPAYMPMPEPVVNQAQPAVPGPIPGPPPQVYAIPGDRGMTVTEEPLRKKRGLYSWLKFWRRKDRLPDVITRGGLAKGGLCQPPQGKPAQPVKGTVVKTKPRPKRGCRCA